MRNVSLLLALLLALSPVVSALTGPYAGTVAQGETDTHAYDSEPKDGACIHLAVPYTVTLAYAPASDVLTLSAGGETATGRNGVASVTFVSGICTSFDIRVTGTSVANVAAYSVTVARHVGALTDPISIDDPGVLG